MKRQRRSWIVDLGAAVLLALVCATATISVVGAVASAAWLFFVGGGR